MTEYKLYVGRPQEVPADAQFSYYNQLHNYILLYTDNLPGGTYKEVPEDIMCQMSASERMWLSSCRMTINAQHIEQHKQEFEDLMMDLADEFEKELQMAQKITEKGK